MIDWGLSEYYLSENEYNVRVATMYFKPPELIIAYKFYHYALDIWSLGAVFAGLVFNLLRDF